MPDAILEVITMKQGSELEAPHVNLESAAEPELQVLKRHLEGSLTDNVVQIGLVNQSLTLVLPERLLFAPGNAELHPAAFDMLSRLAEAIEPTTARVMVTGHADGVDLDGGPFVDNWGLAGARSLAVVRYLERHGLPKARLQGIASTTPAEGAEYRSVTMTIKLDEVALAREVVDRVEAVSGP